MASISKSYMIAIAQPLYAYPIVMTYFGENSLGTNTPGKVYSLDIPEAEQLVDQLVTAIAEAKLVRATKGI